jgi:preprotein translocase subunit SecY
VLSTILNAFRVADIRKKLAFTALILGLYRMGSFIPSPASTPRRSSRSRRTTRARTSSAARHLHGGGLSRIAIFALGIMPYITASIILQLLTVVSPSLEKLQKEGEVGQAKITSTRAYLTVGLAAAQSVGYVFLFRSQGNSGGRPGDRELHRGHGDPHRHLPHRGLRAAHVDGRADHPAGHRQRHLADDLRLDRLRLPQGIQAWATNSDQIFR